MVPLSTDTVTFFGAIALLEPPLGLLLPPLEPELPGSAWREGEPELPALSLLVSWVTPNAAPPPTIRMPAIASTR